MMCFTVVRLLSRGRALRDQSKAGTTIGGAGHNRDRANMISTLYKLRPKCRIRTGWQHTEPYGIVPGELTQRTAAPEGGAWSPRWDKVRGCIAALFILSTAATAQELPSGQSVTLDEVLIDQVGAEAWLRFRFLAPQIARGTGSVNYAAAEGDFEVLCDEVARPYLAEFDLTADMIVISMMDRPVPFGDTAPDATQFFETFRLKDGACVWQEF